jgi:hypothetical protein
VPQLADEKLITSSCKQGRFNGFLLYTQSVENFFESIEDPIGC